MPDAPESLSREQIEYWRADLLDGDEGNNSTRAQHMNALCDMALRTLKAEAERDELRQAMLERPQLERWGIKYQGPRNPHCLLMDDGFWTPWHLAESQLTALTAELSRKQAVIKDLMRLSNYRRDYDNALSTDWNNACAAARAEIEEKK